MSSKEKKEKQTVEDPVTEEEKVVESEAPVEEPAEPAAASEEETSGEDEKIAALEKQVAETQDRYLRTLAEYDNFRRRTQKEKEALFGDGKVEAITKILPVLDNFERAAAADGDYESYKKGIEMTVSGLWDVLKGLGLEAFGEKGDAFDPNVHNGVMHEDNDEFGENVVSDVFLKGYKLGDRVIRHATVKVAN